MKTSRYLILPTSGDLITVDLVLLLLWTVCEQGLVLNPVMGWSAVRAGSNSSAQIQGWQIPRERTFNMVRGHIRDL